MQSHPGLTDLFLSQVREQYALEQERAAAQRETENPLKTAEQLTEDDASMIDGIINNGAKEKGPPAAEHGESVMGDNPKRREKPSIRKSIARKPPEQEKPAATPRKREVFL